MPVSNVVGILLLIVGILCVTAACIYKSIMWPKIMKIGSGPVRVSCVGDSITFGQGVFLHRGEWSYPAFLSEFLGPEYTFFNYGLTNRTLLPVGKDYYFREKTGRIAWNTEADILIFMLGTNDSKRILWDEALFEQEYRSMIQHYREMQCFQRIYCMLPPKAFDEHPSKRDCNPDILEENVIPVIRRIAADCGVELIDLFTLTKDHREWFPDKLHPNKEGNRAIAEEIVRHIREDRGSKTTV